MPDMLEQAIIDAEALREAATKNAETLVLEKFSDEIRGAVDVILEQEVAPVAEDPLLSFEPGAEAGLTPDTPALEEVPTQPESSVAKGLPLAATSTNDEVVEISLDKLIKEMRAFNEDLDFNLEEEDPNENLELEEELELEEDFDSVEEAEIDEDLLEELSEILVVDIAPTKSGWAGTPESQLQLAEEELLALEQDSKVREEKAQLRKAVKALDAVNESVLKQNKKLQSSLNEAKDTIIKLRDTVFIMKEKLDSTSISNAKLLYQNKAMNSDSLNERQKNKLVEAISHADTIEEAKVIFETLQSTVGSTSHKKQPKSLSEAVQKTSSMILSSRSNNATVRQNQNPTLDRWKFLAGIDK